MLTTEIESSSLVIEIGGMPVQVNSDSPDFLAMLRERYAGYIGSSVNPEIAFDVRLGESRFPDTDDSVQVAHNAGRWTFQRGDFRAEWEPSKRRGVIQQSANPYSIDAVLRIVHSLTLAKDGGFLLHSASAIRNGRAFLFSGVSEAGKTTISRLAPSDVTLLTDEISYIRKQQNTYVAHGTPFTGELAKLGENVAAPIAALYFLAKGRENRIDSLSTSEAARLLLSNLLFFADDEHLVRDVFDSTFEFVSRVPAFRLTFFPDAKVWELIR